MYIFLTYLAHFFLEWEMFQTKVIKKIKIHFVVSIFFFENRAVCEKMWKNIVERGRPQMIIWSICITRLWLQSHTLRLCTTQCFSTATMVTRTRLYVGLYVHCLSHNSFGRRSLSGYSVMKSFNGCFSCFSLSFGFSLHWLFLTFFTFSFFSPSFFVCFCFRLHEYLFISFLFYSTCFLVNVLNK